jgi:ABC-type branched-subunit amino acid transport system substrate-binding protein
MRFALDEVGNRAGTCRIELSDAPARPGRQPDVSILLGASGLLQAIASDGEGSGGAPMKTVSMAMYPLRVLPDLRELGEAAAAWARKSGAARTVLLIDEPSDPSQQVAEGFEKEGPRPLARLDATEFGAGGPESLIDRILAQKPDLVFYAGEEAPYGRAFTLFDALRKRGYVGRLAMADADPEVSFLAVPTRVVDGTLLVSPIGPPSREFAAAYEPATGRHAGPHAWPGYLLMRAVLERVDRARSSRAAALREAFLENPSVPRPGALYVAREGKFVFLQDLK